MVEISVIIPVYNCEEFLEETFDCVLNQTFKDFEVICVDDGSEDNSLQILNDYAKKDNRIHVFHQENGGGGVARNFALTKAKGKYIYFMDADDLMELTALEETYELMEKNNVDFLVFKALEYDYIENKYNKHWYFSMDTIYEAVGDDVFHYKDIGESIFHISATPWGKLYNRQFILDNNSQFGTTKAFHDNEFYWNNLFNSKRILFYNKILYYRRVHSNSIQHSKGKNFLDIFPALNKVIEIFRDTGNLDDYEVKLYNWKIKLVEYRFSQIQEECKELFLKEFKNDLLYQMNEFISQERLIGLLDSRNTLIYNSVMESNNYGEYLLLMEIGDLKNQIESLKKKNKKLKKKNKKLKKKNKELKNQSMKSVLLKKLKLR